MIWVTIKCLSLLFDYIYGQRSISTSRHDNSRTTKNRGSCAQTIKANKISGDILILKLQMKVDIHVWRDGNISPVRKKFLIFTKVVSLDDYDFFFHMQRTVANKTYIIFTALICDLLYYIQNLWT